MSIGKLGKRLRREVLANPKKAVFLGLAALLAIYFWIPLVWGWIGKDTAIAAAHSDAAPTVSATVSGAAPAAQTATEQAAPERPSWPQIVQWMHNDPRTMIAPPLTKTREPFETPRLEEPVDAKSEGMSAIKLQVITPEAAGLVLTSTIIGPQRRIAQISGKTYAAGQTIEVANEKGGPGVAFKLIEVNSRRAVLEADGQRFELIIPEPGKSDKIEFLGAVDSGK